MTASCAIHLLREYNFTLMINKCTWKQENTYICIDHIFLESRNEMIYEKNVPLISMYSSETEIEYNFH